MVKFAKEEPSCTKRRTVREGEVCCGNGKIKEVVPPWLMATTRGDGAACYCHEEIVI